MNPHRSVLFSLLRCSPSGVFLLTGGDHDGYRGQKFRVRSKKSPQDTSVSNPVTKSLIPLLDIPAWISPQNQETCPSSNWGTNNQRNTFT